MGNGLARLRAEKKPAARDIPIALDPQQVMAIQRVAGKLARARTRAGLPGGKDNDALQLEIVELEEELEQLEDAARANSITLEVRALKPSKYDALLDAHAPTPEQLKKARKIHGPKAMMEFNPDTFPHALIAACTYVVTIDDDGEREYDQFTLGFVREMVGVNPETGEDWTPEALEAAGLDEEPDARWSNGEVQRIYQHCYQINGDTSQINAAGND